MNTPDVVAGLEAAVAQTGSSVTINVRAQPNGRRDAVTGLREGELGVSVTAAPDKGKANAAIARLLAKTRGVAKSRIKIGAGQANRHKRFAVDEASAEAVREALHACLVSGH